VRRPHVERPPRAEPDDGEVEPRPPEAARLHAGRLSRAGRPAAHVEQEE
jgi:hypothetical protein